MGEANSRTYQIDMGEWLERWHDAVFAIWVKRPDGTKYFANTECADGILTWTIGSGDVAEAGDGLAQVQAIDPSEDKIYMSRVVRTKVYASLSDMESDPDADDPMTVWANRAIVARDEAAEYADEAHNDAQLAEDYAASAKAEAESIRNDVEGVVLRSANMVDMGALESGNISATGEETESSYNRTGYIPVTPGGTYTVNKVVYMATYDADKTFISRLSCNAQVKTVTLGSTIAYVRLTSNIKPHVSDWYMNEGTELIEEPYVPPQLAPDLAIPGQLDDTLTVSGKAADAAVTGARLAALEGASRYNHGPYELLSDVGGWYACKQDRPFGITATTYAEVIAAFDDLMSAAPNYISKAALGTASGTDAGGNGYTLYEYTLAPHDYSDALSVRKKPLLMVTCAIHGFEKCSTYGMLALARDLVEHWQEDARLEAIRNHVVIKVIPVLNPWGFDNQSYVNGNSVNINRNFEVPNWEMVESGSDASGAAPFDQPESAVVRDWMAANPDAFALLDLHTSGRYYASGYANANACMPPRGIDDAYYNRVFDVFCRHIDDQTANAPVLHPTLNPGENWVGAINAQASVLDSKGTLSRWCSYYTNTIGITLEGVNGLKDSNGTIVIPLIEPETRRFNAEIFGNAIAALLREYGR